MGSSASEISSKSNNQPDPDSAAVLSGCLRIYKWKAKYGGMDVSEAKRLKSLEDENSKLKKLLADAMLDNSALKDLLGKNV